MDQVLAQQIGNRTPAPEPRPGRRAERAAAGRRPVDDLRLVYLVGLAHQAGDQGNLSVASVRPARRRRLGPPARSQHSRCGHARTPPASSRRSAATTATSSMNISNRSATSRSASTAPSKDELIEGWRPTLAQPNMPRPKDELPQNRARAHEADARSDRAGVPDGQDAHRDADAQQRSVADELQVPRRACRARCTSTSRTTATPPTRRRCTSRPTSSTSQQFAYLVERMKEIDEGELIAARQFDPHVRSNLFDGDAHSADGCPSCWPATAAAPQDRPHPRLPRDGRRQPPGLQPVPLADGPHGRAPRSIRRRDDTAGGSVIVR